jgi:hypothetical protein
MMSYANTGLANGTYSYQVRALSSTSAVLATSNTVSATVNVAPAPVSSIALTSSVSGKAVTLKWTKANMAGVARYKIMRNGVKIATTTMLSFTNYGLANGTYSYEVDAMNIRQCSCQSNVVSATVNVASALHRACPD